MSESERDTLPEDTVLTATRDYRNGNHVYHSTRCRAVRKVERRTSDGMQQQDRDSLPAKWTECQYCSGEFENKAGGATGRECPLCGASVDSLAAQIRAEHNAGGVGDD